MVFFFIFLIFLEEEFIILKIFRGRVYIFGDFKRMSLLETKSTFLHRGGGGISIKNTVDPNIACFNLHNCPEGLQYF